jgi:signal peptidase I
MHFDFAALMVLATLFTGVVWALDAWLWAPKRREKAEQLSDTLSHLSDKKLAEAQEKATKEPILVEYSRSLFPVILIVLLLRSFLVEPFRIPSGSMMPTLLVGDFILVNKFSYGVRLPVINTKFIDIGEPKRGDVAVFRYPKDPSTDYIKRVIGLPGDRIRYNNKQLIINGEAIDIENKKTYEGVGSGIAMSGAQLKIENLQGVNHKILIDRHRPTINDEFVVPAGHYFVMGDNRDNSNDSRFWGTVPEENLVGKAFLIWMNWDSANGGVSWGRIGSKIK